MDDIVILIPAYNPDEKLPLLVARLKKSFAHIVVVNDGSVSGLDIFGEIRSDVDVVLVHPVNRGKGAALKTGFKYILDVYKSATGVITVDADGQHRIGDIETLARALVTHPKALILGVRAFSGKVPFRSRFGNFWTRWFFYLMTGLKIRDTQTGLRGIPATLLPRMLTLEGSRYEYEMRMLADSRNHEEEPVQVSIATVYMDGNQTSHFHPFRDSVLIYSALIHFCLSSVLSFIIDISAFAICLYIFHHEWPEFGRGRDILYATVIARVISANFNFFYNRFFVFHSASTKRSFFQYWAVVLLIAAASYSGVVGFTLITRARGMAITLVKVVVDTALFLFSYKLQKCWIFRKKKTDVLPQ